jgi:fructuronate reductase
VRQLLSLDSIARLPSSVQIPDYDFRNLRIGVVHLGLGAFHRAHQALYTEDAVRFAGGDWGILGVSLRHAAAPTALAAQDHLYCVETLDIAPQYRIAAGVRSSLAAVSHPEQLIGALASPQTHIVTLTITEKGYCLAGNGELDFAHPDVNHDLGRTGEPISAIGWLAAALIERHASSGQPLTIISCDNLHANGAKLRCAVTAFLERSNPQLLPWLKESVRFPQTVVDCIVPASTNSSRLRVAEVLGVSDLACVQREPYAQWVIENSFAGPHPAWDQVGVQIVADVSGYARLKLHVLNACHSALAYLGLPSGYTYVREAVADPEIARFLEALVATEIAPALAPLAVLEYWATVRARFANARVDHRLSQIAADGAAKLAERVFPLMIVNARHGAPISRLARIVRAWLQLSHTDLDSALKDAALLPAAIRSDSAFRAALATAVP